MGLARPAKLQGDDDGGFQIRSWLTGRQSNTTDETNKTKQREIQVFLTM